MVARAVRISLLIRNFCLFSFRIIGSDQFKSGSHLQSDKENEDENRIYIRNINCGRAFLEC